MSHFTKRYEQYESLIAKGDPACLWISGLHIPESYLTALVQSTCRMRGWPLDKSTFYTVVTKHHNDQDLMKLESGMLLVSFYFILYDNLFHVLCKIEFYLCEFFGTIFLFYCITHLLRLKNLNVKLFSIFPWIKIRF